MAKIMAAWQWRRNGGVAKARNGNRENQQNSMAYQLSKHQRISISSNISRANIISA
jgi:hypothetical protein